MNAYIGALTWKDGELYAGGDIRQIDGVDYNNIAMFNGKDWQTLGDGLDDYCEDIAVVGHDVYAAGEFGHADGVSVFGVARWDGVTWNALGSGLNYPAYTLEPDGKGGVYVGGSFTTADGATAKALAEWDGTSFTEVSGGLDNDALGLATDPYALYAAGWFESVGSASVTSHHIAALRGAGREVRQQLPGEFSIQVLENPVRDHLAINVQVDREQPIAIIVTDMLGRTIASVPMQVYARGQHRVQWNASHWPAGDYAIHIEAANARAVTTFVAVVH
jgi:hypothetical protein